MFHSNLDVDLVKHEISLATTSLNWITVTVHGQRRIVALTTATRTGRAVHKNGKTRTRPLASARSLADLVFVVVDVARVRAQALIRLTTAVTRA